MDEWDGWSSDSETQTEAEDTEAFEGDVEWDGDELYEELYESDTDTDLTDHTWEPRRERATPLLTQTLNQETYYQHNTVITWPTVSSPDENMPASYRMRDIWTDIKTSDANTDYSPQSIPVGNTETMPPTPDGTSTELRPRSRST